MTTGIIIGVVIGIVVSSIYWALIFSNNKKKVRRAQEERDQVIGPVAEKLADIDVLMASFRSGLVQDEEFRKSLSLKLEAVNRLLKPNLHKLDVYYVKYVENLVRDFNRLAYRRSDKSKEIAEVISSMEDVSYGDFQEESVEQEIKPVDEPHSEFAQPLTGIQVVEPSLDQPKEEEMEISLDFSKMDAEEKTEEKAEAKDTDLAFNFEQQITDINEAEEIAESKEPQEIVEIKEPEEIAEIEESEEIGETGAGAQVQEVEIEQPVSEFQEKAEEATVEEPFDKPLEIDEPEQADEEEELFEVEKIEKKLQAAPIEDKKIEVEDEEFAMETIMDLDMSRIPRSPQDFPIELKIPSAAPAEVSDFEENFKEIEATISDESEPEKFNLNIPEVAPAEVQSENLELPKETAAAEPAEEMEFAFDLQDVVPDADIFELELTSEQKEKPEEKQKPKQNESGNDTLTGDDIADKIDAFFKL